MPSVHLYPYGPPARPAAYPRTSTRTPRTASTNSKRLELSDSGKTAGSFCSRIQTCVKQSIRWVHRRMAVQRFSTARNNASMLPWQEAAAGFRAKTGIFCEYIAARRNADARQFKRVFAENLKNVEAHGWYRGLSDSRLEWIAYRRAQLASVRHCGRGTGPYKPEADIRPLSDIDYQGIALYQAHMEGAEKKADEALASHFGESLAVLNAWSKADETWRKYEAAGVGRMREPKVVNDLKEVCAELVLAENVEKFIAYGHTEATIKKAVSTLADAAFADGVPISGSADSSVNPLPALVGKLSGSLLMRLPFIGSAEALERINRGLSFASCREILRSCLFRAREELIGELPKEQRNHVKDHNKTFDAQYSNILTVIYQMRVAKAARFPDSKRESVATTFVRASANAVVEAHGPISEEHVQDMKEAIPEYSKWQRKISSLPEEYRSWMNKVSRRAQLRLEAGLCLPRKVREGAPAPSEIAQRN